MEGDGVSDDDVEIVVTVTVDGDELVIDFDGTADAVAGNVNCPLAVTRSACYFALRVLLPGDVPANAGAYAPRRGARARGQPRARAGAVGGGGRQRRDLASGSPTPCCSRSPQAVELPAQGQGTMNNLIIGGRGWTYYETIGGGQGASAERDGPSGVHVGMTNTLNTPVEALELEYPMRVERYELRYGLGRRRRAPRRRRDRARGAGARARHAVAAHRPPPPPAPGRGRRRSRARSAPTGSTTRSCRRRSRGASTPTRW